MTAPGCVTVAVAAAGSWRAPSPRLTGVAEDLRPEMGREEREDVLGTVGLLKLVDAGLEQSLGERTPRLLSRSPRAAHHETDAATFASDQVREVAFWSREGNETQGSKTKTNRSPSESALLLQEAE